jgi:hypothetical protein
MNLQTLLSPVTDNIYTKLGEECAQNGCAVDLFIFRSTYQDLATIGEVCRLSGGEIYKFNNFSVSIFLMDFEIFIHLFSSSLKMMANVYSMILNEIFNE